MLNSALQMRVEQLRDRELRAVSVAVLDSGIDATHPDLNGRIVKAYCPSRSDESLSIVEQAVPSNQDSFGHGTAVASIISGIANNAHLADYRVLGSDNTGAGDALVASLEHAIEHGYQVINMSVAASAAFASRLETLCNRAYRRGQIVVAARRNMPLADFGYPAEFTSVVSVDRAKLASRLNLRYMPDSVIEFVGHGDEVVVAVPGGGYTTKNGTSFATPAVAGMVAVLLGAYEDLRPFDVKAILRAWSEE
ncbi:MAG: S8 family serine peptidase [Pseudomonadota bacterium]